jgi:hypothetical protein
VQFWIYKNDVRIMCYLQSIVVISNIPPILFRQIYVQELIKLEYYKSVFYLRVVGSALLISLLFSLHIYSL